MKKSSKGTIGSSSTSTTATSKKTPLTHPHAFSAVKIEVISAKNLPAADANGLSDPYVSLQLHDGTNAFSRKTKVVQKNLNPVWNESFEFVIAKDKVNSTDLQLRVWDKDLVGKDLLGDVSLPLSKVAASFEKATPTTLPLILNPKLPKGTSTLTLRAGFVPMVSSDWTEISRQTSALSLEEVVDNGISNINPSDFHSIEGILILKIVKARDLPKEKGATTYDCDPFVIASMGTNTFRTRVITHDPNPVWDEQMILVVKKSELSFSIKFSVYDYDRFSSNDFMATATVPLSTFIKAGGPVANLEVPLELRKQDGFNRAVLVIGGHFKTFSELKKEFWKKLAENFDTNDNNALDKFEFVGMLDSLNTEITNDRVSEMYRKHGDKQELSFDEVSDVMDELAHQSGATEKLFALETCPFTGKPLPENDEEALLHLVLQASADLSKIDRFVMGGFVTEAYAKKGWFNRIVNYATRGEYGVGVDNANIIVQNRKTGQLEEEKMPSYIRLGIRALYQSKLNKFGLGSGSVKALLTSLSIKQGKKYDDPASVSSIAPFIAFHHLSVAEILDPLDSFKNFNEFFYRKLKPSARPIGSPDPNVLLSPADARMMAFQTFDMATNLWIKGKNFTVANLLKDEALAKQFEGGSLAIFRLAPQDYHRYHSPCNGTLGKPVHHNGTLYTVNPMAIREEVDVYTDNKRVVWVLDSPEFGKVALVIIGAMMVGSIILTAKEGQTVKRNDELGYFAFGGSTVLTIFQKDAVVFDADLQANAAKQLETLVMVGNAVGKRGTRTGK